MTIQRLECGHYGVVLNRSVSLERYFRIESRSQHFLAQRSNYRKFDIQETQTVGTVVFFRRPHRMPEMDVGLSTCEEGGGRRDFTSFTSTTYSSYNNPS